MTFRPTTRVLRGAMGVGAAITIALGAHGAASSPIEPAEDDTVVSLPPLIVEERVTPMHWRYLEIPGLEVLSVCDDTVTRDFVRRCWRLEQVLRVLVPEKFQGKSSVPEVQILFNEDLRRARSQEIMTEMLRRHGEDLPPPSSGAPSLVGPGRGATALAPWMQRRVFFLPNLRLNDLDTTAVFVATRDEADNPLEFTFDPDRISYLLQRRVPALPDWFIVGTVGFYDQCRLTPEGIDIEPAVWLSEAETRALAADESWPRTLLSMPELLAGRRPRKGMEPGELERVWLAQCALFVRWALIEYDGARRDGLWTLVERLEREPVSEELFRACLGLGFADARDQLSDYLPAAITRRGSLRAPKVGPSPELKVRAATDLEVARIRGDWERLEIIYVNKRWPELTPNYVAQARRTLQRAYEDGARDPELLAIIGLTEIDAGNPAGARAYLEAAARGRVRRPRVYAELARLRYEQELAAAGDEKFGPLQVNRILEPLLVAVSMDPPLAEVYAIMADVWTRSLDAPTPEDLAVLTEGVRRFPRIPALVTRAIYLNATHGQVEPAAELAQLGARHASDPATRARFERLFDELAPAQTSR